MNLLSLTLCCGLIFPASKVAGFATTLLTTTKGSSGVVHRTCTGNENGRQHAMVLYASQDQWGGDVVPGGKIQGCTLKQVEGKMTEWEITIDGDEADLGKFSAAVYKKIIEDAKKQRFQGFRPGTIPPHLQSTYVAFAMDECARETALEAIQQNNIRPFESARTDMTFEDFRIPPPVKKKKKKKRKNATDEVVADPPPPQYLSFDSMKEAIDAGWKPGQSFSFVCKNINGQQVKDESDTRGATPLGLNY